MLDLEPVTVTAFRFWGNPTDEETVMEFFYPGETSVKVCLVTEGLPQFEAELTASLERNVERRREHAERSDGASYERWPLEDVRPPRSAGGPEDISAIRVRKLSFFEALDGESVVLVLGHPDGSETIANLTTEAAHSILSMTRGRLSARN